MQYRIVHKTVVSKISQQNLNYYNTILEKLKHERRVQLC